MIDKLTKDLTDLIIKSFNNSDNCDNIKSNGHDYVHIYNLYNESDFNNNN